MISEREIQEFIWENKDNFSDLLEEPIFPPIYDMKPWEYTPSALLYFQTISKIKKTWESLKELWLFGCEVPLKKTNDSSIRADFLGILPGRNGIVITELKKSAQTERESYTELLAYGSHLRSTFSPMSKIDIVYLLIAPMEVRIVREATINTLLYDRNDVCALIPTWENDNISTLKLKLWLPSYEEFNQLTESCFSELNFDIIKVTWDGLPGDWSPENKGDNPEEYMIQRMNALASSASQIMDSRGIHGFVFCSQKYSELRDSFPLLNSIIIGGINPYKAAKNKYLTSVKNLSHRDADKINIEQINLLDIIPELKNSAQKENQNNNFLFDLSLAWSNEITGIGFDVIKMFTTSLIRNDIDISYGLFDWKTYQENFMEDIYCHNFDIFTTGLIRELFYDYSIRDWKYIKENGCEEHPTYENGDFPNDLIDIIHSQYYVREFLKRLFDPYHELYDLFACEFNEEVQISK